MTIAVASGKGGTGKTTIAISLADVVLETGQSVAYVDCDVEEPNGHLFLKPVIASNTAILRIHHRVDETRCSHCGLVRALDLPFGAVINRSQSDGGLMRGYCRDQKIDILAASFAALSRNAALSDSMSMPRTFI